MSGPYDVEFRPEAVSDLDRLAPDVRERVLDRVRWLVAHFDEITPEPLRGKQWRGVLKLRNLGDVVAYVNLRRPRQRGRQRGRCGFGGFLPHPPEAWQSPRSHDGCRGELTDSPPASGLLQSLRAGRLASPIMAPAEPRWARICFAAAPGLDLGDRFRGAVIGGAIVKSDVAQL